MFSKISKNSLYVLGSLAVTGISSYLAFKHISKKEQPQKEQQLTSEQLELTLKILRDLRTQLFPLYPTIFNLQKSLYNRALVQTQQYYYQCEAILKAGGPQAEQLKQQLEYQGQEFVIGQSVDKELIAQQIQKALKPEVINIVESKQSMVVKKFKCTVEELKKWVSQCSDKRVLDIEKEIFDSIEKSLSGQEIPIYLHQNDWKILTKDKCLDITKKILFNAGIKLRNMFAEIREDKSLNFDEISLGDNKVINKIADLKLVDEKLKLLIQEGLDQLKEEDYAFALAKACQKHKKNDDIFSAKLGYLQFYYYYIEDLLDKIHENIMDICMSLDKEILSEQCIIDLYDGKLDIDVLIEQQKKAKENEEIQQNKQLEEMDKEEQQKEIQENPELEKQEPNKVTTLIDSTD